MMHQEGDFVIRLANSRRITFRISGNPAGKPVFYLHGTPGSRLGPIPPRPQLDELGVRLITFDRPGYGESDRLAARTVADGAADVATIADYLTIGRFAVLGRSGGGPHALACAARLPERVTRAAVVVGIAPRDLMGSDWFSEMSDSNIQEFTAASEPDVLAARLARIAAEVKADPASLVATLSPELPADDRRVISDARIRVQLAQNFAEALKESAAGWLDDDLAFCSPWGFDVADIRVPVLLWHGTEDVFSPVSHTRWLASRIHSSTLLLAPGKAHFAALEVVPSIISWLIATDGADC